MEPVEIGQELKRQIEEIIGDMECPEDFKCYKSGFADVCKAKKPGIASLLECSEEHPETCKFSLSLGHAHFCECRLRHYIAKGLGI
jgi:hypothetical protein